MSDEGVDEVKVSYDGLKKAIEKYIEACYPGRLLTAAVLFYEVGRIDNDGDMVYKTSYTIPTESSIATAVGISVLGQEAMMTDLMPPRHDGEDEE